MGYWTNAGKADLMTAGTSGRTFRLVPVSAAPASAAVAADLNTVSQIVANEVGAVRKTLANVVVIEDDTNDRAKLDADDPSDLTGLNGPTIVGAWVYRRVGGADADGSDILWMYLALGTPIVTNGGAVTLSFSATGLATAS